MRKLIINLGLVLLLALTPGGAYAADLGSPRSADIGPASVQSIMQDLEASDDPHQAFSQLSAAEQQAVKDSIRENVTIEAPQEIRGASGSSASADGPSCGRDTQTKYSNIKYLGELIGIQF